MTDPNREQLELAARLLQPLLNQLVFVGGCATGLLITDPGTAGGIRPTKDVDTIVEVTSYGEYEQISERLRALGLVEDAREGAPICRWRFRDLVLDVMPTDARILGFTNRWYLPAIRSAQQIEIGRLTLRIITPVYFVATKLDAFHGRGGGDFAASHDLEDVITVIDGRPEIVDEILVATVDVRNYIASEFTQLLASRAFIDALPGFLLPDRGSQARRPQLQERLQGIARASR